jgi:hypothetical protein
VLLFSPEGKSDGRPQDVNISEEEEEKFTRRFFLSFFLSSVEPPTVS